MGAMGIFLIYGMYRIMADAGFISSTLVSQRARREP